MTEKQLKWQKRSRILWRLNGMVGFPFEEGVLTPLEHKRLNVAFSIIRGVVQDSVESSIELGFNAKRRCTFGVCRKPAIEIRDMLGKHQAPEREVLVNAMRRQFIVAALKKCYDVVIDGTLKPHENDFVRRCVKAHNSTVDELRSLGKLSPQDDTRYSIEYKDSIVPLQESTDEDATTATYKKTYKFIGTW